MLHCTAIAVAFVHEPDYNTGMTTPLIFPDQAAFEHAIGAFLREKLSFDVDTSTDTLDIAHGQYVEVRTHKVTACLDGEPIASFNLD